MTPGRDSARSLLGTAERVRDPSRMLDVGLIRRQPDLVRRGLEAKGEVADIDWFLQLDKDFRGIVTELESLKARQNKLSPEIGKKVKAGEDASAERAEVAELKAKQKHLGERKDLLEEDLKKILWRLPNLPADDVPVGHADTDNVVTDTWGELRQYDFTPKAHWDLGDDLGLLDSQRAAKLSGAGFSLMFGPFAQLERALWNYMLDLHTREHGYREVATPYLVLGDALEGTGQLPKFESEMYGCKDDDLWLIPTAEVPLTNIHRREILDEAQLPVRYTGFTPCFRREAGAAGADTRGLIRMHQFHKVELMAYTRPEDSDAELLRIRENAETVLRNLKLPYRVLLLCTGDTSFASRKTFDLEVWAPGCERWLEVSSISTFGDFQARRASLRYRPAGGGKPTYLHTLNGSGLAMPRVIVAILETYQRADGSIEIPDVLRPYMGWRTEIRAERGAS